MKLLANILFYAYVVTLVLAGAWGTFFAVIDQRILLHLDIDALPPITAASVLSQYRFLRAIELGFGAFAIVFRREIFTQRPFNVVFLGAMLLGVITRLVSLAIDGWPLWFFNVFLGIELVGVIVIFIYTRSTLQPR